MFLILECNTESKMGFQNDPKIYNRYRIRDFFDYWMRQSGETIISIDLFFEYGRYWPCECSEVRSAPMEVQD